MTTLASLALALALLGPGDQGAVAPAGAWTTHGGSPARTRASESRPLFAEPRLAWTFVAPGPIEDEPVAWGHHAFVAWRASDAQDSPRGFAMLDLRDGAVVARRELEEARAPLGLGLWEDLLVLRAAPDAIDLVRVGAHGLGTRTRHRAEGEVGEPLVFQDEVYVVAAGALERLARDGDVVWRSGRAHHGRASLRGDEVFVPSVASGGAAFDVLARADGALRASVIPMTAAGGLPERGAGGAFVAALEGARVLYLDAPIPLSPIETTRALTAAAGRSAPLDAVSVTWIGHEVEAADALDGWIARAPLDDLGSAWFQETAQGVRLLAVGASHPDLIAAASAARAAGVLHLGRTAVDAASSRVLWRLAEEPEGPVVPARDVLLVQRDAHTLEGWRARAPDQERALAFGAPDPEAADARIEGARAVLVGGEVLEGSFVLDGRALAHVRRRGATADLTRRAPRPLDQVELVLGEDGAVRFASSPGGLMRGVEALDAEDLARGYAELAIDALPSKDYALVAELVDRALRHGASERDVARASGKLARARADEARDEAKAASIEERLRALERARVDRLVALSAALPEDAHDLRAALVQAALALDPAHDGVAAELDRLPALQRADALGGVLETLADPAPLAPLVRALLPAGLDVPEPFETREWLAFARAALRSPVEIVDPPASDQGLTLEERKLGTASLTWRPDVKGFRSEHLFVITPLSRPGALARCLATGELLCETLDQLFAQHEGASVRDQRFRLIVHLFATREEYLAHTRAAVGHDLAWTAGHFDPNENVSRLYLPDGDESFADVTATLVHELVHQWVHNRCPLFTNEQAVRAAMGAPAPGYWIVEGFASMVEDLRFDTDAWTWSASNPAALRRDLAVQTPPEHRIPWADLLALDAAIFQRIDRAPAIEVPLSTRLGMVTHASATGMFYAQAETVCYFLFEADGGAYRSALLAYLGAYYRGDRVALDPRAAFGMSAEELGRRALEHARGRLR